MSHIANGSFHLHDSQGEVNFLLRIVFFLRHAAAHHTAHACRHGFSVSRCAVFSLGSHLLFHRLRHCSMCLGRFFHPFGHPAMASFRGCCRLSFFFGSVGMYFGFGRSLAFHAHHHLHHPSGRFARLFYLARFGQFGGSDACGTTDQFVRCQCGVSQQARNEFASRIHVMLREQCTMFDRLLIGASAQFIECEQAVGNRVGSHRVDTAGDADVFVRYSHRIELPRYLFHCQLFGKILDAEDVIFGIGNSHDAVQTQFTMNAQLHRGRFYGQRRTTQIGLVTQVRGRVLRHTSRLPPYCYKSYCAP